MRTVIAVVMLCFAVNAFAHDNYTGRSGAPGRNTCASSCHGGPVVNTVQITGFPTNYTPGQAYLLTIRKVSGGTIVNFNSSCRVGVSGTANAGVISAGLSTVTYNVTGETNGVHFSVAGHDSGQFTWTAPAAGTGLVKLYAGAIQTDLDGDNNTIVLTSNEALALPGVATTPTPADMAVDVAVTTTVSWVAGSGATSHDVYFGTTNPPTFIGNQATLTYDPAGDLTAGATYFWRIDERNAGGATAGSVWQFVTLAAPPGIPQHLTALVEDTGIRLNWDASANAVLYNVYRDTLETVATIPANLIGMTPAPTYLDVTPVPTRANYVVTSQ
ncbi:MAG: hypothetical protein IPP40_17745 [bacterium]|nr:hypothetical protein [bacterium]